MIALDFRVYGVHPLEMRNSAIVYRKWGLCLDGGLVGKKRKSQ